VQENVDAYAEENKVYAWGSVDQYDVFDFLILKAGLITIKKSADLWVQG
jgi:hypothetical protein